MDNKFLNLTLATTCQQEITLLETTSIPKHSTQLVVGWKHYHKIVWWVDWIENFHCSGCLMENSHWIVVMFVHHCGPSGGRMDLDKIFSFEVWNYVGHGFKSLCLPTRDILYMYVLYLAWSIVDFVRKTTIEMHLICAWMGM